MWIRKIKRKTTQNIGVQIIGSYRDKKGKPRQRIVRWMGSVPEGVMLDNLLKLARCEIARIQEERKPTLFPAETEVEKAKKRLSAGVKGVGKSGRFLKVNPDGVSLNEEAIA